jgi:hypothetical protein
MPGNDWPGEAFTRKAEAVKRRIAQMESLAYDFSFKSEVVLFGLANWIVQEWKKETQEDMELDKRLDSRGVFIPAGTSPTQMLFKWVLDEVLLESAGLFRSVSLDSLDYMPSSPTCNYQNADLSRHSVCNRVNRNYQHR